MTTSKVVFEKMMTTAPGAEGGNAAGEIFAAHIKDVLAAEFERRKTLESRGATIITTSASMLALVVAVSALLVGKDFVFQNAAAGKLLIGALGAFVVANILAIFVQNYSIAYTVTASETLEEMVYRRWRGPADDARRVCAARQVNTIKSLRYGNKWKARWAYGSLGVQFVAIALLAASAATELAARLTP